MKSKFILTILGVVVILMHNAAMAQVSTVDLGTAESFGVLGGSGVTNTGPTTINGDLGVSPGSAITGFPPGEVNGTVHANNAVAAQAQNDLVTAYVDAASRPSTVVGADLAGASFVSGVYSNAALGLSAGSVVLDGQGKRDSVWIFQSGSSLVIANNTSVVLINGARACMVFWQVTSSATIGTAVSFQGSVLALTSITVNTEASVVGRLLARNGAVTLDTNTIVAAICEDVIVEPKTPTGTTPPDNSKKKEAAALAELLKKTLIASAQVDTINSLPGLTSIYSQGFAQFDTQVFSLQQRFADIRAGGRRAAAPAEVFSSNPSVSGKNPISDGKNPRWGGKNPISRKNPISGKNPQVSDGIELAEDNRWGFFISGTGTSTSSGSANNFDGTTIGANVGVDYRLHDNFVLGVTVGYAHSEGDLMNDGHITADGGKAALYGMYQNGNFFTEGLVGGGYNSYDIERAAFLGDARGDTEGAQFDTYLGMGYDLEVRGWTITPMASLLYTRVGIDGYNEVGSLLPLIIDTQSASSLRSRVGPRVAYTSYLGETRITPSFSAQWQHEFLDDQLPFDARFANDPGNSFTVYGPKVERDSLLVTAALNVAWKDYAGYIAYQGDLGRENYESHSLLIGMRVSW